MWTLFWDMHSGGGTKEPPFDKIYIEASKEEAKIIFYNRFDHNPERVTCTCCGDDYSISEKETLEELSGFHRNCHFGYFDTKGREVDLDDAWKKGKGMKRGYTTGYLEKGNPKASTYAKGEHETIKAYGKRKDVLIIPKDKIQRGERKGCIPQQGYVWID